MNYTAPTRVTLALLHLASISIHVLHRYCQLDVTFPSQSIQVRLPFPSIQFSVLMSAGMEILVLHSKSF
jgi:hypothetical protein